MAARARATAGPQPLPLLTCPRQSSSPGRSPLLGRWRNGRGALFFCSWGSATPSLLLVVVVASLALAFAASADSGQVTLQLPCTEKQCSKTSGHEMQATSLGSKVALGKGEAVRQGPGGPWAKSGGDAPSVAWVPRPKRFLLLACLTGRLSNQAKCMRSSLIVASLLNRTLLVPPRHVQVFPALGGDEVSVYNTSALVDWRRMRGCLTPAYGSRAVMTFEDYFKEEKKSVVRLSKLRCYFPTQSSCFKPAAMRHLFAALKGELAAPVATDWKKWVVPSPLEQSSSHTRDTILGAFGHVEDEVLCLGNLYGMNVRDPLVLRRPAECSNLWRPHPAISSFVHGVAREVLGGSFAAVHLRRGDFYFESLHGVTQYRSFTSIVEMARIMGEQIRSLPSRPKFVYLSTDARRHEVQVFVNVLKDVVGEDASSPAVISARDLIMQLPLLSSKEWASAGISILSHMAGVEWIIVDKNVAALSQALLGTKASSFSLDIASIRCEEKGRASAQYSFTCSRFGCSTLPCIRSS